MDKSHESMHPADVNLQTTHAVTNSGQGGCIRTPTNESTLFNMLVL